MRPIPRSIRHGHSGHSGFDWRFRIQNLGLTIYIYLLWSLEYCLVWLSQSMKSMGCNFTSAVTWHIVPQCVPAMDFFLKKRPRTIWRSILHAAILLVPSEFWFSVDNRSPSFTEKSFFFPQPQIYTGWWLTYPSDKYEFVRLDHHPNLVGKNKTCSKPPTTIVPNDESSFYDPRGIPKGTLW